MEITMIVQCYECTGTGLYKGFAEPEGVAVVCLMCDGSGKTELKYTPFTGRKTRKGIRSVQRSAGNALPNESLGPTGNSITYEEFLAGKMP